MVEYHVYLESAGVVKIFIANGYEYSIMMDVDDIFDHAVKNNMKVTKILFFNVKE